MLFEKPLLLCAALLCAAPPSATAACDSSKLQVQVLGSGGPELNDGRASTSYLVWIDHKARLLVDFGSGAALNYEKSGARSNDLDAILFSHFHVDHTADFPALIKGLPFAGYNKELHVFGPGRNKLFPGIKEFISALFDRGAGAYAYLADYADPDQGSQFKIAPTEVTATGAAIQSYRLGDDVVVKAIAVPHGMVPALGWRVEAHGCTVTFSGDTSNATQTLELLAQGSDLFIAHNAAQENDPDRIARYLHMMPGEIGRIAAQADVGRLILSHRMKRTLGRETETSEAIRRQYKGPVAFADDLQIFSVTPLAP